MRNATRITMIVMIFMLHTTLICMPENTAKNYKWLQWFWHLLKFSPLLLLLGILPGNVLSISSTLSSCSAHLYNYFPKPRRNFTYKQTSNRSVCATNTLYREREILILLYILLYIFVALYLCKYTCCKNLAWYLHMHLFRCAHTGSISALTTTSLHLTLSVSAFILRCAVFQLFWI